MTNVSFPCYQDAEWKSAQIARICNFMRLHDVATTAIDKRRDEIVSLRRAVLESIRISSRKRPYMADAAAFLEAIFSLTAPCHLDGARRSAVLMHSILEQAISRLRDFSDPQAMNEVSTGALNEAMANLFQSCEKNIRRMTALLENADREICSLQDMLMKFIS
ncbi:hypothetical protein [Burkholderia glumae]|uniref:Uncharacterized protein n=1 Tax=Burkholderia glumae TaxID=337 RepID=A0AAQ0BW31_BURGL|nr:hypothetical protein [Burkholderia glumae]AJY62288.1 hypothetical protein KS03_5925 [Burkholderia glumae LMG 2196 = ATCC 33617]MCM2485585.1 hypothetical protein [Burkholderia glumae]MCM2495976.1 hypothetical protein [Burkholderia glumae]MCM2511543.1 hypothetical protein [Burkholderia glumae]MCM2547330.1 hypothetical protein [Burkholderia glumae]